MTTAKNTKTAFLFPGQGAQYPGMGLDFCETGSAAVNELFSLASDITGRDMKALLRGSDEETLKRSDIAQPAITLVNLAALSFLRERGVVPRAAAGFSLGEYAALVCAGVISAECGLRLVTRRGQVMQDAAERLAETSGGAHHEPGMAAVIGLGPEAVASLIARWTAEGIADLYGANFNSPRQVVVSGTEAALAAAEIKFREAGARRVIRLSVAGPFHSPLMADAAASFAPFLADAPFTDPVIPLYSNVTGKRIQSGEEAKQLALRHITESVRWTEEEAALAGEGGVEAVLETGPGTVLAGLWKDTGNSIPCYGAGTVREIEQRW
ncbi:MAG: ACP S-malonyltransferase [Spirochaetaceae bacterium]|jgi:[acyl-carrier-protein] S-malonyltransferase|nr:ACP S-malonyltransferase [Spirochaetaceae bacterium]